MERFGGGQAAVVEDDFHGQCFAHGVGEALCAACAGDDAQVDFRLSEQGRFAGDDHVAGHGEFHAAAKSVAGNGRNDGLADFGEPIPVADEGIVEHLGGGGGCHLFDVGTSGKGAFAAGDNHRADVGVLVEGFQGVHRLGHQFPVERV